tara:strand:+ start:1104 stop:4058 length:2955 start_codon:yes stop_codon:yes gene_type:complete
VDEALRWENVAVGVGGGRSAAMCEALYAANKSFLSLPIDAINAAALTAMMKDRYDSEDAAEIQSREGTPIRDGQRTPTRGQRTPTRARPSPARGGKPPIAPGGSHANGISNANGRVVGRRTPRSNPNKKEREDDVLEMAGAALVSMSPGPSSKGKRTPKKQRDSWSDSKLGPPSEAFGSPTPSPARGKKRSHKELFPAEHAEGSGLEDDEDALGALNGLWMLAESASQEPADRVRKPKRPRPPRVPASPKGKTKRDFQGADPLASPLGPNFLNPGREPGGHTPGSSRKTALKATPPVRMSGGLHTPSAHAQTLGAADLTSKVFGSVGPRVVGEMDGLTCGAKGNGVAGGALGGPDGTPLFGSLASGMYRGAPSAARRRWYLAEHFYSSIDRSWFKADGYRPWLEHIGLGKEEKFNKRDWLVIRAALGKPRRLSLPFLRSERTRLELHRVAIRHRWHEQIQEQIRNGPPPSLNDAREKKEKEKESAADDVKKEGGTDVASIAALADGEAKSSAEKAAKASAEDDDEITDAELKAELAKLVPKDCPKPLCVGDRVVARHPKFLNVHVGTILWGPWNPKIRLCRVQFDRIELGAELVRDFHIAHLPASADPVALEENNKAQEKEEPVTPGGQRAREGVLAATEANVALAAANAAMAAASAVAAAAAAAAAAVADGDTDAEKSIPLSTDAPETAAALLAAMTAAHASMAKGDDGSQIHAEDTRVMAEVTQALDRKQALIAELRAMNDTAEKGETVVIKKENQAEEGIAGASSPALEPFQRQYASTMLKIHECNQELARALVHLREQHGKHESTTKSLWQRFIEREETHGTPPGTPRDVASTPRGAAAAAVADAKADVLAGLNPAAEIVAASMFTGRRMAKTTKAAEGEGAAKPAEDDESEVEAAVAYVGNCIASLLAVKVCQDHAVAPELTKDVIDRCLERLKPQSDENLPLHEKMKEAFVDLHAKIYAPWKKAAEEGGGPAALGAAV